MIHGYDINSLCLLGVKDDNNTDHKKFCDIIVSGADEKILRLYEPPPYFINFINNLSKTNLRLFFPDQKTEDEFLIKSKLE